MSGERLRMQGIRKTFAGTVALAGVDFELLPAEVHALIGENGAGKSTLVKILCGVHPMDEGSILVDGRQARIDQPRDALALGINMIHQEFANFPKLSVAENVFIGKLPRRKSLPFAIDSQALVRRTTEMLSRLRLSIDPTARLASLTTAQQQLVEVVKALSENLRILIMDEATSSLNLRETRELFSAIEALKLQGISVIYISHRLDEVLRIADRITVLRDGANAGTFSKDRFDQDKIVEAMLGKRLQAARKQVARMGDPILSVRNLTVPGKVHDFSLTLHRGEILGISGLSGSGKEVLVRSLYGLWPARGGTLEVNGKRVEVRRPSDALSRGIVYLAEERKLMSIFSGISIRENASVIWLRRAWKRFFTDRKAERAVTEEQARKVNVRMAGLEYPVDSLSGGNQQKLLLARLLMVKPDIIILNDPTRGVDVGSKQEIYETIFSLARQGTAMIITSSEIPEVAGLADRVLVLSRGKVIGELSGAEVTVENVLALASRATATQD